MTRDQMVTEALAEMKHTPPPPLSDEQLVAVRALVGRIEHTPKATRLAA